MTTTDALTLLDENGMCACGAGPMEPSGETSHRRGKRHKQWNAARMAREEDERLSALAPLPLQVHCPNPECGALIVDGPVTVREFPLTCRTCETIAELEDVLDQNVDAAADDGEGDLPTDG